MNWKLLLAGFSVHLLFFYSIFDIYFTSPLVHGMTPQSIPFDSPAKRLVLFVTDGLRADKLFHVDENSPSSKAPYLRSIMESSGAWGVSHTRVPTESRPGHVALIAGFYEDVSAVAKGWKENPVEFDSVFNESRYTWSWGSPDILPMFAKGASGNHVFTKMYPAESEDFAGADSSKLDTWVFDTVEDFLTDAEKDEKLHSMLMQDKIIFFLHLLGLDTNGHSHKPFSSEYLENIGIVDGSIERLVKRLESFYHYDNKTAFILSADHGMTDWGSHGAGHASETLTPLIAWGAGIRGPIKLQQPRTVDQAEHSWNTQHLHRYDVWQADICPLMSSLIGIPFSLNSVGTLPIDFLDNTDQYKATALYSNAKQLLAQFDVKMEQKRDTTLSMLFTPFRLLTTEKRTIILSKIEDCITTEKYSEAISEIQFLIKAASEGLLYYHNYDRLFLGTSIVLGFVGWMAYITVIILQKHTLLTLSSAGPDRLHGPITRRSFWSSEKGVRILFLLIASVIASLLYVQSLPLTHYCYTLLPVLLWYKVIQQRHCMLRVWWYVRDHGYIWYCTSYIVFGLAGLEIIVSTFFFRGLLSVGLLFLAPWPALSGITEGPGGKRNIVGWLLSCLTLAVFPLLPPVGRDANYSYVFIAGFLVIIISGVNLVRSRPRNKPVALFQMLCLVLSTYNVWSTSSSIQLKQGLPDLNQFCSWMLLISSVVTPLLTSTVMYQRLLSIAQSLLSVYLLLSTSHEGFFVLGLCALMLFWVQLEHAGSSHKKFHRLEELDFSRGLGILESHRKLQLSDLRIAYFFILFLITAFYGTGNIASINSFDPSTVYCFLTVFNPFVMGSLLLLKIVIPFIIVSCTFNAIHLVLNVPTQSLFLLVLLISDFMALHFFLLVKDSGSWLDIGTSISHYVIVMCLCCFLLVLLGLSHFFTNVNLGNMHKKHIS